MAARSRLACFVRPTAHKTAGEVLTFSDLAEIPPSTADERFMLGLAFNIADSGVDGGFPSSVRQRLDAALVVGAAALGDKGGETIALEVVDGDNGCVDWELLVVDTETVTVSVRVGEETRLEDGIGRWLDVRDKVRRRECSLEI